MYTQQQITAFQEASREQRAAFLRRNHDLEGILKANELFIDYVQERDHLYIGIGTSTAGMALFLGRVVAIADPDTLDCIAIEVPDFAKGVHAGLFPRGGKELLSIVKWMPVSYIPPDAQHGQLPAILAEDLHRELAAA